MTSREYIYRMLEMRPISNCNYHMVTASDIQIEATMIAFAQAHVKKALEQASEYGNLVEDSFGPEDILNCYPIENIK